LNHAEARWLEQVEKFDRLEQFERN